MSHRDPDVVGLLPAAGSASRLRHIPCSKEILPVGFARSGRDGRPRPRAAAEYLLDGMSEAGAGRVFMVLREGKWDIPAFLGNGGRFGLHVAYLVTGETIGVPYTLAAAVPFLSESRVLFGFPDILFEPRDALSSLLARQEEVDADVVLGLFPASHPSKMDMVRRGAGGRVESIIIKPERTELEHTWILASWTPDFTEFLAGWCEDAGHRRAQGGSLGTSDRDAGEPFVGHVIQDAIDAGMMVDSVLFESGMYVDIGTPEELAATMERLARAERHLGDDAQGETAALQRDVEPDP